MVTTALPTTDPLAPLLDLPGVAEAVAATRTAVDTLLNNKALRRNSHDVSAESALRGAWASAWLAGVQYPLEELRSGAVAGDPTVQGARIPPDRSNPSRHPAVLNCSKPLNWALKVLQTLSAQVRAH